MESDNFKPIQHHAITSFFIVINLIISVFYIFTGTTISALYYGSLGIYIFFAFKPYWITNKDEKYCAVFKKANEYAFIGTFLVVAVWYNLAAIPTIQNALIVYPRSLLYIISTIEAAIFLVREVLVIYLYSKSKKEIYYG